MTPLGYLVATVFVLLFLASISMRAIVLAVAIRHRAVRVRFNPFRRHVQVFTQADNPGAYWAMVSVHAGTIALLSAIVIWIFTHTRIHG